MLMLLLQSFLLLLAAFLTGAAVACVLKRVLLGDSVKASTVRTAPSAAPVVEVQKKPVIATPASAASTERFGRALTEAPATSPQVQTPVTLPPVVSQPPRPAPPAPPPPPAAVLMPKPAAEPPPRAAPSAAASANLAAAAATAAATVSAAATAAANSQSSAPKTPEPPVSKAAEPPVAAAKTPDAAPAPPVKPLPPVAPPAAAVPPVVAASEPWPFAEPRSTARDDLTMIRGIDERVEPRLNALGVNRYWQIAGWLQDDTNRMSQSLGYSGRIEQDNWIEQARVLARGDNTAYSLQRRQATEPVPTPPVVNIAKPAASEPAKAPEPAVKAAEPTAKVPEPSVKPLEPLIKTPDPIPAAVEAPAAPPAPVPPAPSAPAQPAPAQPANDNQGATAAAAAAAVIASTAAALRSTTESRSTAVEEAPAVAAAPDAGGKTSDLKSDLSNLRSVRSEALRGTDPISGTSPRAIGAFDDLKRVRGIGVLIERKLNSLGITTYEQIANWTGADVERVSQLLDFKGRVERENWIEQSRILASGGQTEFSRRVDRGEVETSR